MALERENQRPTQSPPSRPTQSPPSSPQREEKSIPRMPVNPVKK
jgi:hypothetical protein